MTDTDRQKLLKVVIDEIGIDEYHQIIDADPVINQLREVIKAGNARMSQVLDERDVPFESPARIRKTRLEMNTLWEAMLANEGGKLTKKSQALYDDWQVVDAKIVEKLKEFNKEEVQ